MKCPICSINLQMSERNGIEIDYCPECRGVWLDRGELDKILERSNSVLSSETRLEYSGDKERKKDEHYYESDRRYHKKHKRESWLGEIFDF